MDTVSEQMLNSTAHTVHDDDDDDDDDVLAVAAGKAWSVVGGTVVRIC